MPMIQCENCGASCYKEARQLRRHKHHFCSQKCHYEFGQEMRYEHPAVNWDHTAHDKYASLIVEVTCPDCDKIRFVKKGHVKRGRFTGRCRRCHAAHAAVHQRGEKSPAWKGGRRNKHNQIMVEVICPCCGKTRLVQRGAMAFEVKRGTFTGLCESCNKRGEKNYRWKGGRTIDKRRGYVRIMLQPDHQFFSMADGKHQVQEHRLIMAQSLGRPLTSKEIVHHEDHDPGNNAIENLRLMSLGEHTELHRREKRITEGQHAVKPWDVASTLAPC